MFSSALISAILQNFAIRAVIYRKSRIMSTLTGTHVIVIGGTAGIGLAVALQAVASGARVTVASSSPARIESAVKTIQTSSPSTSKDMIHGEQLDLSDPETYKEKLDKLFSSAAAKQQVTHVVYTAGDRIPITPIESLTLDDIQVAIKMRMIAPMLVVQTAVKYLPRSPASSIILTNGAAAEKAPPGGWSPTAFLAGGLKSLAKALAVELKPIRINVVQPGVVDTGLWDFMGEAKGPAMGQMAQASLTGRVGKPEDVARAYMWLMTDSFVTGTTAQSDGGYFLV
ncbi:hypothetical protein MKZ38_000827 [Zalerion maritima]|uniref:Uncharacterized protein n=1 Tax=Zalerion maritima TaxID=339359 RepID=A0AAD5RR02_9PEZI|nr:hypothetical protein MKZ38_000827 [Zalerion maritima]